MFKKILMVLLSVFLGIGFVFSQEPPQKVKAKIQQQYVIVQGRPDLRPSLWVECCGTVDRDPCDKVLEERGYFLVNYFNIHVYNAGTKASSSANGKVEFFDVLTNSRKTFNFTVDAVPPKGWGRVNPPRINGPFLVRKSEGIKVSVTFSVPVFGSKTNITVEKGCSILI